MNEKEDFAERLRIQIAKKSEGKKISQSTLAKAFNCQQSFVSQMLNAEKLPGMETAVLMSRYFDCCVEFLLTGRGPERVGAKMDIYDLIEQTPLTPAQKTILRRFCIRSLTKNLWVQTQNQMIYKKRIRNCFSKKLIFKF